ncbi:MAG: hypothetical protein NWE80_04360 [Candidatus Bathyarchaeota archaeon]|nr:hypothetical protein [Candidatus Bathyarchaeota archaeon]
MTNEQPDARDEPKTFELEETKPEVKKTVEVEEHVEVPEPTSECLHYLGYLSEKESKEKIPEQCITCKDIVTCMLKKMKE